MYAKLVFQTGTDFTLVNRDIVRCITNSNGAGGSTLAALENVVVSSSSISDTEASNWALASGQTLATGASVEQDKRFYLQQAHANSSTKTVAFQTAFRDATGFTKANETTYSGVHLCPVSDYGESYEAVWHSTNPDETPDENETPWNRLTGQEVHIIAKDKVMFVAGIRTGYQNGTSYCMIFEVDAAEVREGRNKPGQVVLTGSMSPYGNYSGFNPSTIAHIINITASNPFGGTYHNPAICSFVDVLHDYEADAEMRYAMMAPESFAQNGGSPSTASWRGKNCCVLRDINDADGHGTFSFSTTNDAIAFRLWADDQSFWGFGPTSFDFWPFSRNNMTASAPGGFTDISGNPAVLLRPSAPIVGLKRQQWDFSGIGGYYTATANFQGNISTINDGTDDYIAIKLFSLGYPMAAAIAIRK